MGKAAGLSGQKEVLSSCPVAFLQGSAWAPESSGLLFSRDLPLLRTWPRSLLRLPLPQTERSCNCG